MTGTDRVIPFGELEWRADRLLFRDLVFRLQHYANDAWDQGDECFMFFKIKQLADQYQKFFESMPKLRVEGLLELGLWDGGSAAFWFELLQLRKYVGLDRTERQDSAYFRKYVESRGIAERMTSYWGVDQADAARVPSIVAEFQDGLDLVVDDAAHRYAPTKASFELIFPLLKPGALYIIEDWGWEHWPAYQAKDHPWAGEPSLTDLVNELVAATGSALRESKLIERLAVYGGFVVVERGTLQVADPQRFQLASHISTRPK